MKSIPYNNMTSYSGEKDLDQYGWRQEIKKHSFSIRGQAIDDEKIISQVFFMEMGCGRNSRRE